VKKFPINEHHSLADNTGYCKTQKNRTNAAKSRGSKVERKKQKPPVSDKSLQIDSQR
jgi:hypothetical protein